MQGQGPCWAWAKPNTQIVQKKEGRNESMEQPALLEMRHISKEFPGVKALDDVSLTVRPGTVHALMGENGAGKSTMMKCLFGI